MKSFDYVTRTLHVILKQIIPVQFLQNQNVTYFITKPESSLKEGGGGVVEWLIKHLRSLYIRQMLAFPMA